MKIFIYGAGAIGGYLGVQLALSGATSTPSAETVAGSASSVSSCRPMPSVNSAILRSFLFGGSVLGPHRYPLRHANREIRAIMSTIYPAYRTRRPAKKSSSNRVRRAKKPRCSSDGRPFLIPIT